MTCDTTTHGTYTASAANGVRRVLRDAEVLAVSIVGGPGCGKTSLIEKSLRQLAPGVRVGIISCDAGTRHEADRLSPHGAPIVQIKPGASGHLDVASIAGALLTLPLRSLDLLLIENAGSLTPANNIDLGQTITATIFSVAGGDDKADKHPDLVRGASAIILNKVDLLPTMPFKLEAFEADVRRLNPTVPIFQIASLNGDGIETFALWLSKQVRKIKCHESHWFG